MPLDSDVANADTQLHVEFYEFKQEGPYKGTPFVRIVTPGDKTNIIDQPARDDHKRRFQRQWLFFQAKNAEGSIIGTPLLQWHQERPEELTEGQLAELSILKFQSVEQVATASDTQIQRVGMGAAGLRERARSYLSSKNAQTAGAEMEALKAQVAALTALLSTGQNTVQATPEATASKPPVKRGMPKGGWPKKPQAVAPAE